MATRSMHETGRAATGAATAVAQVAAGLAELERRRATIASLISLEHTAVSACIVCSMVTETSELRGFLRASMDEHLRRMDALNTLLRELRGAQLVLQEPRFSLLSLMAVSLGFAGAAETLLESEQLVERSYERALGQSWDAPARSLLERNLAEARLGSKGFREARGPIPAIQ